jgi:ribonuclease BN (tRNA processing enzyme)
MQENNGQFQVKFRGVRGSHTVSSPNILNYGGNTSCVEIRVNGHTIIIDAGTGIIDLGNDLLRDYIASGTRESSRNNIYTTILFSHTHFDHICGLPFFKPAFVETSKISMFGPDTDNNYFEDIIANFVCTPYFPINLDEFTAEIDLQSFITTETILLHPDNMIPEVRTLSYAELNKLPENTVVISAIKSQAHPKDGVLIFKVEFMGRKVVFASDIEGYIGGDVKLINFARNADLLIHDSQYIYTDYASTVSPKQGFGHSTPEMAAEVAKIANVKQLAIYHMDPSYNDEAVEAMEAYTRKYFPNTLAAKEGLEINLL